MAKQLVHALFRVIEFADIMRGLEGRRGSGNCWSTGLEQRFSDELHRDNIEIR
ncbi:MAG: hypothetical protein WBQ69_01960 [Gallionella sp.]